MLSTNNFYIKKDLNENIKSYNTEFKMSPTLATTKYVKLLSATMKGSKNYVFSYCGGSLALDENGKLKTLQTSEKYSLDFNLFGEAYWPVTCTSSMKYDVVVK